MLWLRYYVMTKILCYDLDIMLWLRYYVMTKILCYDKDIMLWLRYYVMTNISKLIIINHTIVPTATDYLNEYENNRNANRYKSIH